MYCYSFWIRFEAPENHEESIQFRKNLRDLEQLMQETLRNSEFPYIQEINQDIVAQYSLNANHRGQEHDDLLKVLRHTATIFPTAHGLVYWYDSEPGSTPPYEQLDIYRVIVLARGRYFDRYDPFFSPFVPHIQDEP